MIILNSQSKHLFSLGENSYQKIEHIRSELDSIEKSLPQTESEPSEDQSEITSKINELNAELIEETDRYTSIYRDYQHYSLKASTYANTFKEKGFIAISNAWSYGSMILGGSNFMLHALDLMNRNTPADQQLNFTKAQLKSLNGKDYKKSDKQHLF